MDFINYNREAWNKEVENNNIWTRPVSEEDIRNAKNGEWDIVLTSTKSVPKAWFPSLLENKKVLCLASGGGQQGPIMAALGAEVTVFDNSPNQLSQDILVAEREGLTIRTELGDMRDLSRFEDESFDLIIHPTSNCFIDNVLPVWKEAYRILKKNGVLLAGFSNSVEYIFDLKAMNKGELVVKHKIPYSDIRDLSEAEFKELITDQNEPACFGHSLEDQIQGQIDAGFVIAGFYEDNSGGDAPLDPYINTFIATKAIKL
ncbi:class I SAM-dependent methyltransferase [Oceanirhabdus sp. W0125-5]|uniref:class I SAM-dependent methyltransferase n=1 Tax=Oceanirhabdus sp. W0125-5 TaxID=2999116 RepID=UPI0022F2D72D|nr:class I SAM-dependent methyltransferase [Oceanirhabdus sp. W0125-5]WBW97222.1 class I SAM-dependent methyltransferase [Oceanirhabdus sp. W0125-5]